MMQLMKLIIGELNPGAGKDGDGCESDSGTIWKHRNLRVRTRQHIAATLPLSSHIKMACSWRLSFVDF